MRDVTIILTNGNRARVQLEEETIARYAAAGLLIDPATDQAPADDPAPVKTTARKGANKSRTARKG